MRAKILSWNAEGAFVLGSKTRRAVPEQAIETLEKLETDIAVIPEFGDYERIDPVVLQKLGEIGYDITLADYADGTGMSMALLSRLPVLNKIEARFADLRSMPTVDVCDNRGEELRIVGVHLDDAREENRLRQAADLVEFLAGSRVPTVVAGDFNAMDSKTWFARLCRTGLVESVRSSDPERKFGYVAQRLSEMALGTTIDYLRENTSLKNCDPHQIQPTISARQRGFEWLPSWRLAKIDWTFCSPALHPSNYQVHPDAGSDHRPITFTID